MRPSQSRLIGFLLLLLVVCLGWAVWTVRDHRAMEADRLGAGTEQSQLKPALPAEPVETPREVAERNALDSETLGSRLQADPNRALVRDNAAGLESNVKPAATVSILRRQSYLDSGIESPSTQVINTASDWAALKNKLQNNTLPAFNPKKETAIAIFIGTRNSGGYAVNVNGIRKTSEAIIVDYTEVRPGPDDMTTQALTSPGVLVVIPKTTAKVRFQPTN